MTTTFTLKQLQEEQGPWVLHNFGDRPAWQPLLGLVEELGELSEAVEQYKAAGALSPSVRDLLNLDPLHYKHAIEDALADTVIFMSDFCNSMEIDMETMVSKSRADQIPPNGDISLGRVAHSFLKNAQGIRGTPAEHRASLQKNLGHLYWWLDRIARGFAETPLLDLVQTTWSLVKKRDWKKNPTAGTIACDP